MTTLATLYASLGARLSDNVALADTIEPANRAIWLVAKRLFYHKSGLVRGDLSISITANSKTGTLPSDFAGLMGSPNLSSKLWKLTPLPDEDTRIYYADVYSTPRHYEILSTTILLIPGSGSAETVVGPYFKKPTTLTDTTDTIPWNGVLDDLIGEYLVEDSKVTPIPEAGMQQLIISGVDEFIKKRDRKQPTRFRKSVDWKSRCL